MEILSFGKTALDLFFPARCLNCDAVVPADFPLCVHCAADLPYTYWKADKNNQAYRKLKPFCKPEWAHSLLFFRHGNVTQKLLHNLKYNGHQEVGGLLAEKTIQQIDIRDFDGVIPVPVHPKKLKKRGYNQVMTYAQKLAENAGIPLINDFLIRVENNPSQVSKNRERRLNSIQNAFDLKTESYNGKYILIDDVLTSGATLSTCINLIQSRTNAKIAVMTIAIADGI